MGHILAKLVTEYDDVWVIISSDLSHYLPYEEANIVDSETIKAILDWQPEFITWERACGYLWIRSFIVATDILQKDRFLLVYANSWDTAGDKSRVVGYTSIVA
jgi:AmmeMemoRadiSam system protein B